MNLEQRLDTRLDRRTFLRGAAILALVPTIPMIATVASGCELLSDRAGVDPYNADVDTDVARFRSLINARNEEAAARQKLLDLAENIRSFELELGSSPLSFSEAKSYNALLAEFFIRGTNSPKSAQDILNDTFIIRDDFDQLVKDYPDFDLSNERKTTLETMKDRVGGWVANGRIFLPINYIVPQCPEPETVQHYGLNPTFWERAKPVTLYRTSYLHELAHHEADRVQDLDEDIARSYQRVAGLNKKVDIKQGGQQDGFVIYLSTAGITEQGLEEMMANYVATKLSSNYDLPYDLGDPYLPADMLNLDKVLAQAGINFDASTRLHRQLKLKEFMMKVASSAKGIELDDDESKLDLSTKLFLYNSYRPNWRPFKYFFPEIDPSRILYLNQDQFMPQNIFRPGCNIRW